MLVVTQLCQRVFQELGHSAELPKRFIERDLGDTDFDERG